VLNVVTGTGLEAGKPLSESSRIAKIAFTGETSTGRIIMKAAAESLIPVTMELGGTSTATTIYFMSTLRSSSVMIHGFVGTMIVIEYT
jgi:aldehyde dehydrogenase